MITETGNTNTDIAWIEQIERWLANGFFAPVAPDVTALAHQVVTALRTAGEIPDAQNIGRERMLVVSARVYALCRAASPDAQETGYGVLHEYLYRAMRVVESDSAVAQDAAQRAVERVMLKITDVDNARAFFRWAKILALRELSALRAKNAPAWAVDEIPGSDGAERPDPDGGSGFERIERRSSLDALGHWLLETRVLSRRLKFVFWLYYVLEWDVPRASRLLNMTPGAFHVAAHRVREALRQDARFYCLLRESFCPRTVSRL
jgi:DNA-directed RNA polymerase specialized sigma24 family protein